MPKARCEESIMPHVSALMASQASSCNVMMDIATICLKCVKREDPERTVTFDIWSVT